MNINQTVLDVVADWAGTQVTDTAMEFCPLLALGRGINCDNGILQTLINSLRSAMSGVSDLSSLRPSDMTGTGNIKNVNSLLTFVSDNLISADLGAAVDAFRIKRAGRAQSRRGAQGARRLLRITIEVELDEEETR